MKDTLPLNGAMSKNLDPGFKFTIMGCGWGGHSVNSVEIGLERVKSVLMRGGLFRIGNGGGIVPK